MPKIAKNDSKKEATSKAKKSEVVKKDSSTKEEKKVAKKTTKTSTKSNTEKKSAAKAFTKSSASKAKKTTKKAVVKKAVRVKKVSEIQNDLPKEVKKDFANVLEYYDLPYRYNETVVKILAQTPKILFVYWDISDSDCEKYVERYGKYFFNDTYPVLIVHNKTKNYVQEIEINDFANSWYISISDPRSEYSVELGRRFKEYASRNEEMTHKEDLNSVVYVTTSNDLVMPNDHVLLDEVQPRVQYRNVKTGEITYKDTKKILANNKLIDFYELYKGIYQVNDLSNFFALDNPSSGNPTSTFR